MQLKGKAVSSGIVIGEVLLYKPFIPTLESENTKIDNIEAALKAYRETLSVAESEMEQIEAKLINTDPDKAQIIGAHKAILQDPALDEEVVDLISNSLMSPDAAVNFVFNNYITVLGNSKNAMMRERASDLRDVKNRILRCWAGEKELNLSSLDKKVIVVADDLFPSDTVSLDKNNVLGIITQVGGPTSHTAIIAKSYKIPAILGVEGAMENLKDGKTIILDAVSGKIFDDPSVGEIDEYTQKAEEFAAKMAEITKYVSTTPFTKDNVRIDVLLNVAAANDHELSGVSYSDGCGLFRTEFLFLNSDHLPSEDEQYKVYRKVLEAFGDKPVVLRTLDIGGDKQLPSLELPKEDNPFLGIRGIRLCLEKPELFKTQIRAALRASVHGNLRIMMPMVGSLDEVRSAKNFISEQGRALDQENIPWDKNLEIGIMIEVPSIALIVDLIVDEVDFVSIGTNDLCQYLTAADRMNPEVKPYHQEYHPAMFRTIGYIAKTFNQAGKPASVCGEMAGDPLAIPALVGLGISKLSMGLASIAGGKKTIQSFSLEDAKQLAIDIQNVKTETEVKNLLTQFSDKNNA